jgi:3'-phosphoadenosine 5'-phosphosulfate (PAPS) 3'-phosphatase
MKDFVELFDSPQFNSYGSSLKLLMVAEGDAHVYPRCVGPMGLQIDMTVSEECVGQQCAGEWDVTRRLHVTICMMSSGRLW